MDFVQLQCFVALVDELHFSRAAMKVGMSQSAFSERIRGLERDLGVSLANRDSRNVHITEAGQVFYVHSQKLLAGAETARRLSRLAGEGRSGEIRIGSVPSALSVFIPLLVRKLHNTSPALLVRIDEDGGASQITQLTTGDVDLVITREHNPPESGVGSEFLYSEPLAAFVSRNHALASRSVLRRSDLWHHPLIMWARDDGPEHYDQIIELAQKDGTRSPIVEAPNTTSERAFAAASLGVAIRPWSWPARDDSVVRIPISGAPRANLFACYRAPLESSPIRHTLKLVHEVAATFSDDTFKKQAGEQPERTG